MRIWDAYCNGYIDLATYQTLLRKLGSPAAEYTGGTQPPAPTVQADNYTDDTWSSQLFTNVLRSSILVENSGAVHDMDYRII